MNVVIERQMSQKMSHHLRKAEYVAGVTKDFTSEKLLAPTLLDQPIVMLRNDQGGITALGDRCAHR